MNLRVVISTFITTVYDKIKCKIMPIAVNTENTFTI